MAIIAQQRATVRVAPACAALAVARATFCRRQQPAVVGPRPPRGVPRALSASERRMVLSLLNDDRFAELPPAQVYATLLDEGKFVCSISTMYRVLRVHAQVKERRRQLRHPRYPVPELLATRPNTLWSWDITKLKGPAKWTYVHLDVILDVFSRYVVGWMAAYRESATLAQRLIEESCPRQGRWPTAREQRSSSRRLVPQRLWRGRRCVCFDRKACYRRKWGGGSTDQCDNRKLSHQRGSPQPIVLNL